MLRSKKDNAKVKKGQRGPSRVLQGSFKGPSGVLQGSFRGPSGAKVKGVLLFNCLHIKIKNNRSRKKQKSKVLKGVTYYI